MFDKFGGILKEESLSCIESGILLNNTCVLESVNPFVGYYSAIHGPTNPLYLYLMLEDHHHFEEIQRAIVHCKEKAGFIFEAAYAEITLPGYPTNGSIRIRNLHKYSQIETLQKLFQENNIRLKKKTNKIENINGLIRLEKFFYLEEASEGIYFDKMEAHHGYFETPGCITWKNFVELTKKVKQDTDLLFFDAAQAYFFEHYKITDMIRIYRENLTLEKMQAFRDRYLKYYSQYC